MPSPSSPSRLRAILLLTAAASVVGACATVPRRPSAQALTGPATLDSDRSFAAPSADWVSDRWWEAYGDPQLTRLIDEALVHSPTLAQAEARLHAANAQSDQSRAAFSQPCRPTPRRPRPR